MAKDKSKIAGQVKQIIEDTSVIDANTNNDTIRIWENYRDQAMLWRGIALLQIAVTFICVIAAVFFYLNRNITLNVPSKPLPGYYPANEVPESEYIDVATNFVNLISTYQYRTAERQFLFASEHLVDPFLSKFQQEMLKTELKLIQQTQRTQLLMIEQDDTKVKKLANNQVQVVFIAFRTKSIAGKEYETQEMKYTVNLTTVPRNKFNPYGVMINDVEIEKA